ncbi:hypothetical protein SS322685_1715 [Shigella sonnei 3226-85]|nr:hypothetical protein SS53G_4309 [Shigella sonnei 53G]EIQ44800.1 hypothetical protein SS322685_1715 [Shigella sonnei 3226-85]EIQ46339.1 hypothetical protein SS323385_1237 [Shigella sonnei 3233-85]
MIFGDDQNAFFSLANVFYVRRCRGATGKSQHLAAAASEQSSGWRKQISCGGK